MDIALILWTALDIILAGANLYYAIYSARKRRWMGILNFLAFLLCGTIGVTNILGMVGVRIR